MSTPYRGGLRKRLLEAPQPNVFSPLHEIAIESCSTVCYSSEDPAHPIEHMFDGSAGSGSTRWISARADTTESIVLAFDRPQHIAHLIYEVEERLHERTQELHVEVSHDNGCQYRRVLVQEFNFSPNGASYECESLSLQLNEVTHLRLTVVPNKSGSGRASISSLRLFS